MERRFFGGSAPFPQEASGSFTRYVFSTRVCPGGAPEMVFFLGWWTGVKLAKAAWNPRPTLFSFQPDLLYGVVV